jgi:outer membrane lipase/esterase
MKRILTPLAAACLLAGASLSLHASPYSSLVVFGDSLSDAGWSADSDGPDGATTRFTNRTGPTYLPGEAFGPVAPMILGERLGLDDAGLASANAGGNNWAVGGYRTDQILDSIDNADGYLASVGGRADPNALYYLTGGGNDFLQFRVTSPETAQAAAGRLVDSLQTLQQSGARYIMVWLLPDVGKTPAISTTPLA